MNDNNPPEYEPTEIEILKADIKNLKERIEELERIVENHRISIYGPSAEDE